MATKARKTPVVQLASDPHWYKTAVVYELHVRAFCDSNADGVGDFPGLISKLDYLRDLGITAIWLLPFYPSPLRDGGYDIADYTAINPAYGTMADFRRLLDEAHARGIRIITELVINHTSIDHRWFQRARRAPPGSPERELYVWSDTPQRYSSARIIFKDFESSNWSWDPVANAYYWHRFYSHQPDLNFDNPAVHDLVFEVLDFWFELGVDGLRLDAIPYLYQREGTSCENLPETHAFLKKLRAHVDDKYRDRMLLAEANQWPSDAAAYFGAGDECHMNFHFPLMPRMFMAVQMEDRFPIIDILRQTPPIPMTCQWATFLRNHDELTLEMVTDEERDYMYQTFSEDPVARINLGIRRRLAPLLKSRRKIELMNALLFSLPGTPVLYYGDEIGMGDNVYLGDRDGVRTPMQWSADRNAGFSRANPQRLYLPVNVDPEYHYEARNVETQQLNPSSLLHWMKRLIAVHKQLPMLGAGELEFIQGNNSKVLAFARRHVDDILVVAANLSRFPQHVHLDLSNMAGRIPIEVFGRTAFPPIEDRPYPLSFGPHSFYWFSLERPAVEVTTKPNVVVHGPWTSLLADRNQLARLLVGFAVSQRWYRAKARVRRAARVVELIQVPHGGDTLAFAILEVEFSDGPPERYLMPLEFAVGPAAEHVDASAVIAHLELAGEPPQHGVLYDALVTGRAAAAILDALLARSTIRVGTGKLVFSAGRALREVCGEEVPAPRPVRLEQSNTTIPFGDKLLVKVFRQLEAGVNSELELGTYLTQHGPPGLTPAVLGSVNLVPASGPPTTMALAHAYVPNQGTAWDMFGDELERMFEAVLSRTDLPPEPPAGHLLELSAMTPPDVIQEVAGHHLRRARRLGERTAEVHAAFAESTEPDFVAERFTMMYQQSLYQAARSQLVRTTEALATRRELLPPQVRATADEVTLAQPRIEARLRAITEGLVHAVRIRTHGDLHLGQVLFTGDDFVLIDFEGEPARPLRERRYRRCPLRDVAGMLRSFSYAAEAALHDRHVLPQDTERLRPWARCWTTWVNAAFLAGYLERAATADLISSTPATTRMLIDFYLIEKCIYEVGYELNNRPDWLPIPVADLLALAARGPA